MCTESKWSDLDKKRKLLYGGNMFDLNLTQYSSMTKADTLLLWDLGESIFPDMKKLSTADKNAIIANFFPRWILMESAIDYSTNYEHFCKFVGSEQYHEMLLRFYANSMPKDKRLKDSDVIRIFVPYWNWHYSETALPVYKKQLDKVEYMAIFLMLLFDDAYANISENCAKMCQNIRKVILRELNGYQTEKNCDEMKLIDTMDTLLLLEKAEEKLQEEFLMCGLTNVTLHDDFKAIMQVKKL
uniref:NR LBD domain-containing protein n=1 Tax=Caenorhabditis japonica TaxID=281687 RepID=A0A8R1HG50_CAEJA